MDLRYMRYFMVLSVETGDLEACKGPLQARIASLFYYNTIQDMAKETTPDVWYKKIKQTVCRRLDRTLRGQRETAVILDTSSIQSTTMAVDPTRPASDGKSQRLSPESGKGNSPSPIYTNRFGIFPGGGRFCIEVNSVQGGIWQRRIARVLMQHAPGFP